MDRSRLPQSFMNLIIKISEMNTLKYAPIAFLIFYLGYCEGGFMKDPSVDEIIRGVYAKVPSETEQVVPTGLTMDQHVQRITMEFKGSDGIRKPKLEHLIGQIISPNSFISRFSKKFFRGTHLNLDFILCVI
ncbi:hypothetical protein PSTT_08679 [Puccinia striiformis]|uniref:Uncharacterized protein n=1 Tax=Puccinia striiformis TaxID=27350 RepID=A0A2S4VBL7_9BASI|nr:hypothetical protein PSTT_08679 [Puccinia striiformis]